VDYGIYIYIHVNIYIYAWFEIEDVWTLLSQHARAVCGLSAFVNPVPFLFSPNRAQRCLCVAAFLAQTKVKQALFLAPYIKNCHFARPNLRSVQLARKNVEAQFFFKNYVTARHFKYLGAIYPPHNFMDWFVIRIIQRFPLRSLGVGKLIFASW